VGLQLVGETGIDVGLVDQMLFGGRATAQIYAGVRTPFVEGAQFIGSDGVIRVQRARIPGLNERREPGPDSIIRFTNRAGKEVRIMVPPSNS
jgi:hypothetical protein